MFVEAPINRGVPIVCRHLPFFLSFTFLARLPLALFGLLAPPLVDRTRRRTHAIRFGNLLANAFDDFTHGSTLYSLNCFRWKHFPRGLERKLTPTSVCRRPIPVAWRLRYPMRL